MKGLSKTEQYNEYLNAGGTMSMRQWEEDGRFDKHSDEQWQKHYEIEQIRIQSITALIIKEHTRAKTLFPKNFCNQHEAIAVIREEYLELEKEIFLNQKNYNLSNQRKEAIQLAAMCIRFINELTK